MRLRASVHVGGRNCPGWLLDHLANKFDLTFPAGVDRCAVVTQAKLLINMSDFKTDCNKVDPGL